MFCPPAHMTNDVNVSWHGSWLIYGCTAGSGRRPTGAFRFTPRVCYPIMHTECLLWLTDCPKWTSSWGVRRTTAIADPKDTRGAMTVR